MVAKMLQKMLNQISVGSVLTVEDQIRARLDIRAKIYSHQIDIPSSRPGKMMTALTTKAVNSTVFAFVQYSR